MSPCARRIGFGMNRAPAHRYSTPSSRSASRNLSNLCSTWVESRSGKEPEHVHSKADQMSAQPGRRKRPLGFVLCGAIVVVLAGCSWGGESDAEQQATGGCKTNSDCPSGLVCGRDNGPRFGLPATTRVCGPTGCLQQPLPNCGRVGAPCGTFCSNHWPCSTNGDCPQGQVCGSGNGPRFNDIQPDVCWVAGCETNPSGTGCGTYESVCGSAPASLSARPRSVATIRVTPVSAIAQGSAPIARPGVNRIWTAEPDRSAFWAVDRASDWRSGRMCAYQQM